MNNSLKKKSGDCRLTRASHHFKYMAYDCVCRKCQKQYEPYVLSFHHVKDKKHNPSLLLRKALASGKVDDWIEEAKNMTLVCRNCHATHHQALWVLANGKQNTRALKRQAIKMVFASAGGMRLTKSLTPACLEFHHTGKKNETASSLLGRVSNSDEWMSAWVGECVKGRVILMSANHHATLHETNLLPYHVGPFPYETSRKLTDLAIKEYAKYLFPYTEDNLVSFKSATFTPNRWKEIFQIVRADCGFTN